MRRTAPLVVRLAPSLLLRRRSIGPIVRAAFGRRASHELVMAFEFGSDERDFSCELVARKTNLWLFRTNQRRFCGDFVVVDMSCPLPAARTVRVLDLKRGRPLRLGGGGAGCAFRNAGAAVEEVAWRTGAVAGELELELLTGGAAAVLAYLGAA
jgi:hypothetical protein